MNLAMVLKYTVALWCGAMLWNMDMFEYSSFCYCTWFRGFSSSSNTTSSQSNTCWIPPTCNKMILMSNNSPITQIGTGIVCHITEPRLYVWRTSQLM